jgi:hypothetical protein
MSYIRGDDRRQAALLPAAVENHVAADAPVRVIMLVDWIWKGSDLVARYRRQRGGHLTIHGTF